MCKKVGSSKTCEATKQQLKELKNNYKECENNYRANKIEETLENSIHTDRLS